MRYTTILFDADGTLLDFSRSEDEAIRETMLAFDIVPDDERVCVYSEINDNLWKALERKEIEKEVLLYHRFELFCEHYGFVADAKKMAAEYMNNLSTKGYTIDGADELCEKLSGKVRMYIVTNGVEFIQNGRFARCPIEKYFEKRFISGVIGYEKPDVRYFECVASEIPSFEKDKTIIVGDSLTSDIKGGINFGIDTCWYNPKKKDIPVNMDITHVAFSFDDIYRVIIGESENGI